MRHRFHDFERAFEPLAHHSRRDRTDGHSHSAESGPDFGHWYGRRSERPEHHHGRSDHGHERSHARHGRHGERSFMHELWHAIGRHRHGHGGGGGFWGGRGERGFGDDDSFTRGRKFSGEDLQLMLLALIAETPRHGYELIKALETRSNGFYTPSPGMVYPALTYLEELGFVTVQQEGNRKRYEIADAGRAHLAANQDQVDMLLAKLSFVAHKMESMRRAYAAEDDDDGGRDARWHPKLRQAKYALKLALLRRLDADEAEQLRVAEILLRAAAQIEGQPAAGPAPEGSNL
ncbi:PadR family transcriptional regulator [Trinickia diaoshuihuensis]|uniref:PadR family transcriptional regulator n=1 Tax=Trinickia diaoshuihuensis TaxID=2292265 RepID=UPI000E231573|nr:PadR family transcriptional regulator [Trinickia diaoshuihuensis]